MVQNPGAVDANVTMTFQLETNTAAPLSMTVPANSRTTVHLDDLPGLDDASVSTKVTCANGATINAERAMYFVYYGDNLASGKSGGHDSIGTLTPSKTWYMAEGYTGGQFDTWVLVQNPTTKTATVTMKFQLESGTAPDHVFTLPAGGRQTVHLNELEGLSAGVSVSTKVTSNVDVVAERAMYFNYYGKDGGSDCVGIPF